MTFLNPEYFMNISFKIDGLQRICRKKLIE